MPRSAACVVVHARPLCERAAAPSGPDATFGFDVNEYEGLWRALSSEKQWPAETTLAAVGPAGEEYAAAAEACLAAAVGCKPLQTSLVPKSRLQSVRMLFRCDSPDAFCALHSSLKALPGTKAVV